MKNNKTKIANVALMMAMILFFSACAQAQKDISKEIQAQNDILTDAIINGDQETVMAYYNSQSTFLPPNGLSFMGVETISMVFNQMATMGVDKIVYKTKKADLHGKVAIEEGKYQLFAQGETLIDEGKYIVTWEKQGNYWIVLQDIWNSSLPLPPQAAKEDTLCLITMKIKADAWEWQKEMADDWLAISEKENPDLAARSNNYMDLNPDKNGNYTFHSLVAPYHHGKDNLDIRDVLLLKYSESEADAIMNKFKEGVLEHRVHYIRSRF